MTKSKPLVTEYHSVLDEVDTGKLYLYTMHHIILISISIALSLQSFAQTVDDRGYIVKIGDALPALNITLTDGTQVYPDYLKGKVVLIQFTGTLAVSATVVTME